MLTVGQTDGQTGIQPGLFNWGLGRSRAQSPRVEHLGHVPCILLCSPPDTPLSGRLLAWTAGPSSLTATPASENSDSALVPHMVNTVLPLTLASLSSPNFQVHPRGSGLRDGAQNTPQRPRLRDQKATSSRQMASQGAEPMGPSPLCSSL